MKALVIREHGDLDRVEYSDIPKPQISPVEVRVKIRAAALNHLDLWVMRGWPGLRLEFPHVLGADGAGVIEAIGEDVSGFEVGDAVAVNPTRSCGRCRYCLSGRDNMCDRFALFGEHIDGLFAEYAAVPVRNLLKLPDAHPGNARFEEAAAASLVYVTVWQSLIVRGMLQAGESVLIVGAGGGVNTAAIQVAKLAGASPIYVVGSSEDKLTMASQLGADVTVNRLEEDWGKAIFRATGQQGVDVVVDNVGAATFQTSLRALRKGGRLLTVGNTSGPKFEIDNRYVFGKHLTIIGSTMGTIADYEQVMGLVFAGLLRPLVDSVFPLSEGRSALERLHTGRVSGKLVLRP